MEYQVAHVLSDVEMISSHHGDYQTLGRMRALDGAKLGGRHQYTVRHGGGSSRALDCFLTKPSRDPEAKHILVFGTLLEEFLVPSHF